MKMNKIAIMATLGFAVMMLADRADADDLSKGCEHHDTIGSIPSPINENVFEIQNPEMFANSVRISLSFAGEPVSAGAWVLLHIENGEGSSDCYLVHRGSGDDQTGFNDAYVSRTIVRPNRTNNSLELFIPVSEYPFAADEDHKVRMVEVNISEDGQPVLID